MKAIILAAGYATRLYPLTKNMPKALLPIGDKPIIDYIVESLITIPEMDGIYVVTNHKFAAQFEKWALDSRLQMPLQVLDDGTSTEEERLGAIGDIQFVLEQARIDDDLIIIAGDNFFTYRLKDYVEFYNRIQRDCVCVKQIDDVNVLKQVGVAVIDENNILIDVEEKPDVPKSDIGIYATYIYKRETLPLFARYLAEGNKHDAPGYFVQWLYKKKEVAAYRFIGECYDIGTPEAYKEVQELFSS